jgi:hypothetical protein
MLRSMKDMEIRGVTDLVWGTDRGPASVARGGLPKPLLVPRRRFRPGFLSAQRFPQFFHGPTVPVGSTNSALYRRCAVTSVNTGKRIQAFEVSPMRLPQRLFGSSF